MKVKVRTAQPTVIMTKEMYNSYMHDIEQFLEENKTLRLRECHLQDELHIVKQQNKELERQIEWLRDKNDKWAMIADNQKNTIAAHYEEKKAFEDAIRSFEETRKDYEETIHNLHVEKREWMEKYEEEYHRRLEAEHSSP